MQEKVGARHILKSQNDLASPYGAQQGILGTLDWPFFRRDIGKVAFKITGNGMRYTYGTGNFVIFRVGKREKYQMIA